MQQDVIDAMMGFDPENMTVFQQKSTNATNPNIYKTNPKDSKSEDGNYRSKLRILYNPYSAKDSIVDQTTYAMRDENGFFMVNALPYDQGGRDNCPLFKAWKTVFFASSEFAAKFAAKMYPGASNAAKREALLQEFNSVQGYGKEANDKRFKGTELGKAIRQYSNENFDRVESSWVLVQVIEDINKPELVGSIKVMKLPRAIRAKLDGKMHPSKESGKKPVDLMSWVLGYPLEMEVKPGPDDPNAPERRQREISYDLCEFAQEFEPICKVDGTPLFNEEQIAILDEFATARSEAEKGKSEAKRKAAQAKIENGSELYMKVRELVGVAYNYLKEVQIVDIVKECAYQEWDTATNSRVQKWIDTVTLANFNETSEQPMVPVSAAPAVPQSEAYTPAEADVDPTADGLPF